MWRAFSGVIHCVFDQVLNLQNCFTTPKKPRRARGSQTDKLLPPSTFIGQFLRKADIMVWCLYRYLVHASYSCTGEW